MPFTHCLSGSVIFISKIYDLLLLLSPKLPLVLLRSIEVYVVLKSFSLFVNCYTYCNWRSNNLLNEWTNMSAVRIVDDSRMCGADVYQVIMDDNSSNENILTRTHTQIVWTKPQLIVTNTPCIIYTCVYNMWGNIWLDASYIGK